LKRKNPSSIGEVPERTSLEEIRQSVPAKYLPLFDDRVFESWILSKLNSRKTGISISSFQLYVHIIHDLTEYCGLTPGEIAKKSSSSEDRLEWKLKMERWFNLMVGQVAPQNASEKSVPRHEWNSAKKWLIIANEFLILNNVNLNVNMPATADPEEAFVPSKELLRKGLEICDEPNLRSYILIAKDCAISEIDLLQHNVEESYYDARLKREYESVSAQYRSGKIPIAVVGRRQKTGVPYVGFLGEEAVSYLEGGFPKGRLIGFESKRTIQHRFKILARRLEEPLFVPKSLRAFTSTAVRSGDMNETKAKILSGHKIRDIEKFYVNFRIDVLAEAFQKVYGFLRILS
jgi:hypothetical protein